MRLGMSVIAVFTSILAACDVEGGSDVANITFDGTRYQGGSAIGYRIEGSDLASAGRATDVRAQVDGDAVFSLNGVDPEDAVVMNSATSESEYLLFFREGVEAAEVPFSEGIPGLCSYLEDAPPGGCP